MPGIAAVLDLTVRFAETSVQQTLSCLSHVPWLQQASFRTPDGTVALGALWLDTQPSPLFELDDGSAIALDGELYDAAAERRRLASSIHFDGDTDAELLLRGWLREGAAFLARLHGRFAAVVWNAPARRLSVLTDRFGMRSVHVAQDDGGVRVASEVTALVGGDRQRSWSRAGVAQFFAFGHFLNDDTFYEGIRAVPAASAISWTGDGRVEETRYWQPAESPAATKTAAGVERLDAALAAAVARRARPGERLGLSLSGGLDARTLLGLAPPGLTMTSVSLGMEGSIDHRGATRLAALAGIPHHRQMLDASFLGRFEEYLADMIRLTDGHYLDQGIVMSTLPAYRDLGIDYLLRGHGGELLHMRKAYAYSLDDGVLALSAPALRTWLFEHLTAYMLAGVPVDLFTFDVRAEARAALDAAIARAGEVRRPVDLVWPLFINERLHRETALSMHLFDAYATVRMPFIDNDVIDALLALPAEAKLGDELQTAVLRHHKPAFLDVVNSNTGVRMGAGPLAVKAGHFRMRVYAKLGVKGYQPYERLGLWLRRELKPLVDRELVSDAFEDQGLFNRQAVQRVVEEHAAGRANHTFLIMALLIFAVGGRRALSTTMS